MISPRPVQNCGELRTKNGVSLPGSAARAIGSARFGQVQVGVPVEYRTAAVGRTAASPAERPNPLVGRMATPSTPYGRASAGKP